MTKHLHLMHARVLTAAQRRVAAARGRGDEGQGTLEYVGVAFIVAAIIAVLVNEDIGNLLKAGLTTAIEQITQG